MGRWKTNRPRQRRRLSVEAAVRGCDDTAGPARSACRCGTHLLNSNRITGEGWKLTRMDPKKRKVSVALVLVGVVLVYLIATAASNTTMYYLTVAEAVERQDDLRGRFIRVAGEVPGDSIQWAAQDFLLTFDVVQGDDRVSAVYRGVRPDNLIDGANVVLEGTFGADGVFPVDRLLVQCVSKYEAAVPEGESPVEYIEIDGVLYESYPSSGGRVR